MAHTIDKNETAYRVSRPWHGCEPLVAPFSTDEFLRVAWEAKTLQVRKPGFWRKVINRIIWSDFLTF